jgi:hypothetical protein
MLVIVGVEFLKEVKEILTIMEEEEVRPAVHGSTRV